MTLSYAGINLPVPSAALIASIEAAYAIDRAPDLTGLPVQPSHRIADLTWPLSFTDRGLRVNRLYWPHDASRFGFGHFVVHASQLAQILPIAIPFNGPPTGQSLVMTADSGQPADGNTWKMFALPPRPLLGVVEGGDELYLLPLVDDRYFWRWLDVGQFDITSSTTWAGMLTSIASVLYSRRGVTLTWASINSAFGFPCPESALTCYYESLPHLLDAILTNVGQRLAFAFNGTTAAAHTSIGDLALLEANLLWIENQHIETINGGPQDPTGGESWSLLPGSVKVCFERWNDGTPLGGVPYVSEVQIGSLDLGIGVAQGGAFIVDGSGDYLADENGNPIVTAPISITGTPGAKVFHDTYHALFVFNASTPSNSSLLNGLARAIAADYYERAFNASWDVTYALIINLVPEGLHDLEFTWRPDEVSTRMFHRPYGIEADQLMHANGAGPFKPFKPDMFFAEITARTGSAYAWQEVIPQAGGTFILKIDGRSGIEIQDPAYEFNGSTSVAPGTYVIMWKGFRNAAVINQEWLFQSISGGGFTPTTGVVSARAVNIGAAAYPSAATLLVAKSGLAPGTYQVTAVAWKAGAARGLGVWGTGVIGAEYGNVQISLVTNLATVYTVQAWQSLLVCDPLTGSGTGFVYSGISASCIVTITAGTIIEAHFFDGIAVMPYPGAVQNQLVDCDLTWVRLI